MAFGTALPKTLNIALSVGEVTPTNITHLATLSTSRHVVYDEICDSTIDMRMRITLVVSTTMAVKEGRQTFTGLPMIRVWSYL